jgi:hypothetical protein
VESLAELRFELMPKVLVDSLKRIEQTPQSVYLEMTEAELRKEVRRQTVDDGKCGMSMCVRARIVFWEEYERAARAQETMNSRILHRGIARPHVYWGLFERFPALLPWIICPITGYLLQRKELEFLAEERMIEIMSVSAVKEDGKVDSRLAKVQLEMYQMIQDRNHGPVVQKVQSEQKNLNVNVNTDQTADQVSETINMITDVEQLRLRIEEVKKKREALSVFASPITINQQKLMRPDIIVADERTDKTRE